MIDLGAEERSEMAVVRWLMLLMLVLLAGCEKQDGAAGSQGSGDGDSKFDSVLVEGEACSGTVLETGCACQTTASCAGVCLSTDHGPVCASSCDAADPTCPEIFPGGCPPDWRVIRVDEVWHCLPPYPDLCRPCVDATDCDATSGALCISYGVENGQFCGGDCSGGRACPPGYICHSVGSGEQCISESGGCECSPAAIANGLTTECQVVSGGESCEGLRMCTADGLSDCIATLPGCGGQPEGCIEPGDPGCVVYYEDADGDSYGVGDGLCLCAPSGVNTALVAGDCVDSNPTIHPGKLESCNGADDDCDGVADEDASGCTWLHLDGDGDGHGAGEAQCVCAGTPGWVSSADDCDDNAVGVHPGAVEICGNAIDEDCVDGPLLECAVTACYPGADNGWATCVELVGGASVAQQSAYQYPSPSGSPNAQQYQAPTHFLDLTVVDPGLKIAKNFTVSEVMSAEKGKYGVFQPHAIARIQQVRDTLGVPLYITSGYRSPGYNATIDGAATYSRHVYGDAVDCHASGAKTLAQVKQACANAGVSWSQGPPVYESHVHCDWRNEALDESFYGALGAWWPEEWMMPPQGGEILAELMDGGTLLRLTAETHGYDEGIPVAQWVIGGPDGVRVRDGLRVEIERPESGSWWVDLEVGMNSSASLAFEL